MDLSINSEYKFPHYSEMVSNLFKIDIPGNRADLMHAAIGIAGECGEVLEAKDRINLFEEFGDIEFYVEALKQRLARYGYAIDFDANGTPYRQSPPDFLVTDYRISMVIAGCSILDAVKKCWIYNDREPKMEMIAPHIHCLEDCLQFAYDSNGVLQEEIRFGNQVKLIGKDGRYKTGKYSDEQALARADKVSEGETQARAALGIASLPAGEAPGYGGPTATTESARWPWPEADASLPAGDTATVGDAKLPVQPRDAVRDASVRDTLAAGDTATVSAEGQPEGTGQIVSEGKVHTYTLPEVDMGPKG